MDREEELRMEKIFVGIFEPMDLATDLLWLYVVVDSGPFSETPEYECINFIGWVLLALNLARYLSARRSRSMIREAGLEGSRSVAVASHEHSAAILI